MIHGRMKRLLIIFAVFALAACASSQNKKQAEHAGLTRILYSPTGDPLNGGPLGHPACPEAVKHWFDRVDANHDGTITLDEFINDSKIQFQRMDIDKNGYLVSEELERFRMPYRNESAEEKPPASSDGQEGQQLSGRHHGSGNGSENSSGGSNVIDPVMSADANLDYKVTPDEFIAYSRKVFTNLDADHKGKLSPAEVTTALCGSKP